MTQLYVTKQGQEIMGRAKTGDNVASLLEFINENDIPASKCLERWDYDIKRAWNEKFKTPCPFTERTLKKAVVLCYIGVHDS